MITRVKKTNPGDYYSILQPPRYPNEFKKKVVIFAEKHNNSEAERTFGVAESNVRRWRKLKPIIFSKGFVSESVVKKKRLVKQVAENNEDFMYEIQKVNMLSHMKKPSGRDYSRPVPKSETSPRTSTPYASPNLPGSSTKYKEKDVEADEVCLRWNSHHSNMKMSFPSLLEREQYVDVTLTTEGRSLKCHRLILSSCSSYFDEILNGISPLQHPVIFLNGVEFWVLKSLIDFMYSGEVHIEQNRLETLLKVAEMLQIKGLTGKSNDEEKTPSKTTPIKIEDDEDNMVPIKKEERPPPQLKREEKIVYPRRESSIFKMPIKKPASPTLIAPIDPLSLLEPTFFEENPVPLKFKEHIVKKVLPKKLKKRKLSEHHEPSPPPILYRKGTKSRPHVKVPRYYHNDYEDIDGKRLLKKGDIILSTSAPNITTLDKIKPERMDVPETNVQSIEKRRTSTDKSKSEEFVPERVDMIDEIKNENSQNTNNIVEILEKEIKQEKIEDDLVDPLATQNTTI